MLPANAIWKLDCSLRLLNVGVRLIINAQGEICFKQLTELVGIENHFNKAPHCVNVHKSEWCSPNYLLQKGLEY
jgi:hypothetical protein